MPYTARENEELAEQHIAAAAERADIDGPEYELKVAHVYAMLAVAKRTAEQTDFLYQTEQYRRSHS